MINMGSTEVTNWLAWPEALGRWVVTCTGCPAIFRDIAPAHCQYCHNSFASGPAYQAHRPYAGCLAPQAVVRNGVPLLIRGNDSILRLRAYTQHKGA